MWYLVIFVSLKNSMFYGWKIPYDLFCTHDSVYAKYYAGWLFKTWERNRRWCTNTEKRNDLTFAFIVLLGFYVTKAAGICNVSNVFFQYIVSLYKYIYIFANVKCTKYLKQHSFITEMRLNGYWKFYVFY